MNDKNKDDIFSNIGTKIKKYFKNKKLIYQIQIQKD